MSSAKIFLTLGAALLAVAVAAGAFGAHALRARLAPDMSAVYHTAVQYHFYHALGLLALGLAALRVTESTWLLAAGWAMVAGIVLFSGSLYLLSLSGMRALGAITPFGGLAFIVAWVLFAIGIWRSA